MKKFGDVVSLVQGPVTVNALVAQSVVQPDGKEHLIVTYLDPSKDTSIMGGQNLDSAIKKSFPAPLEEGMTYGWKDLAAPELPTGGEPSEETGEQAGFKTSAPAGTDFPSALKKAGGIITEQADKITELQLKNAQLDQECNDLHAALAQIEKEAAGNVIVDGDVFKPADPTSFADVQAAQAAAKEAAQEASADPTSGEPAPSTGQDAPSPSPESPSNDSSQDSGTSE